VNVRRAALFLALAILASQAAAVGFGFTVSPRLLFPLYYPYEPDMLWQPDQGVMAGFGVSLDLSLFPGFTAGPYLGALFTTDTFQVGDFIRDGEYVWSDLVIGALLKYSIPTGGPWLPWIFAAPGYGSFGSTIRYEYDWGTYENDNKNTGGFGLDAGIGVDYRLSETLCVGLGAHVHLNTADTVEYEIGGETTEWELEESPLGLGVGMNLGLVL
jgi:hypothetical protein